MSKIYKIMKLINPGCFVYYWRQYRLVRKFKGRMVLKSWALTFEDGACFNIEENSYINIGKQAHVRFGTEIVALDGSTIDIGSNFFANKNCSIVSRYGVKIGSSCMLAPNVQIFDHDHDYANHDMPFCKQGYNGDEISIGDNVWIGANSFIGKGVNIGNNVIIGAGTVITRSVPACSVVYSRSDLIIRPLHREANAPPSYL